MSSAFGAGTLPIPASSDAVSPPNDATKNAVLLAAPQVFQLERLTSGMAAVIFEFVRRWKLYEREAFKTMLEYASARLGVKSKQNYKEYARAGTAMWTHYECQARRVISYVAVGGMQLQPPPQPPPHVPVVSVLRELPRALRRTAPAEHAAILAQVEAGECTYDQLRLKGRVPPLSPTMPPAPDMNRGAAVDANNADDHSEAVPVSETTSLDPARPAALDDAPDLEAAALLVRNAKDQLNNLVRVWDENPGPDVDPIRQRVQAFADARSGEIVRRNDGNSRRSIVPRNGLPGLLRQSLWLRELLRYGMAAASAEGAPAPKREN